MKRRLLSKSLSRSLATLLSLLLVIGLFSVGFAASAATRDLRLVTFGPADLLAAAEAAGTINSHGNTIYTTYKDTIGIRSIGSDGYFVHSLSTYLKDTIEGAPPVQEGDTVRLTLRLNADEDFADDGYLLNLEWVLWSPVFDYGTDYVTGLPLKWEDYLAADTQIDPVTGVEYKEFVFETTCVGDSWTHPESDGDVCQSRITAMTEAPITLYYYKCENVMLGDAVLLEVDGPGFGGYQGLPGKFEYAYPEGDNFSAVVSYMGLMETVGNPRNDNEPYTHNAFGFNHTGNPALLMDSLGVEIPEEGDYVYNLHMKTCEALGTADKCRVTVLDGETELASTVISGHMVNQAGGQNKPIDIRIPFTVGADQVGHKVTFRIDLFDSNDFFLYNVSLLKVVDANATAPTAAREVEGMISAMEITSDTARPRQALDALNMIDRAWVSDELVAKLEAIETEQSEAATIQAMIDELPAADAVTTENVAAVDADLTRAEQALEAFEKTYDAIGKVALISNWDKVAPLREAVDAAKAAAQAAAERAAAVQGVEEKIAAIGELTKENFAEKKEPIEAAEQALADLKAAYGDEIAAEVDAAALQAAREAYDAFAAEPTYTLGDINGDGAINASDALLALQHSVKLITLEGDKALAADVSGDGAINASDALLILQYSVKLIDRFPVQQ